ncbi:MAG: thiamine-phosphate kinase [Gammaproteobacteria bacterium]|nr:thiamine-phosphate kinase [Gammaproteobacteria bacterium]
MALAEFSLISRFFKQTDAIANTDVALGIGDDAAIINIPADHQLCTAVDTLVAGVHFPKNASAYDIGHKALAVNLSDLAAMGAVPRWFTLALTLPNADETWLAQFSKGLLDLARTYNVSLIGGDTTSGPLCISINIMGTLPQGEALQRCGATARDDIYVSGFIGDAGLGLHLHQHPPKNLNTEPKPEFHYLLQRLHRPNPRVELGRRLSNIANAAIDVSDGLLVDLNHILQASNVGATINLDAIPLSAAYRALSFETDKRKQTILAIEAGDDYELCFTADKNQRQTIAALSPDLNLTRIGEIVPHQGLHCIDSEKKPINYVIRGYQHFHK